jgi:hypothetical protein
MRANHKVWISTDYDSGNMVVTWTPIFLSDSNLPSGTNWQMNLTSLALPSNVFGEKKVRIAYIYTCDENESTTWRINNVLIEGK